MANINWDSHELESTAAQVNTLLQNYDKTMDEIQQTLNTMEFRLKLRTDVDNDLSKLKRRVSQERSKMQQVRQAVNLAASKTTDLNGKLIGYTNDIGNLSIQSSNADIGGGNCVNFLEGVTLSSIGIGTIGNVISSFVSKIKNWFTGEKGTQGETSGETIETSRIDYSGVEHPNTISNPPKAYGLTENTGTSRGNAEAAGLRYYAQMDASTWTVNGSDGKGYLDKYGKFGCGLSAMAMVSSYYYPDRNDFNPGLIVNRTGLGGIDTNSAKSVGLKIKEVDRDSQLTKESQQIMIFQVDKALSDYQSGNGAPPVVRIDNGSVGNGHYIVILGKSSDGSYIITDSNQKSEPPNRVSGCTRFVTTVDVKNLSKKDGTYTSYIKQIYLFDKLE